MKSSLYLIAVHGYKYVDKIIDFTLLNTSNVRRLEIIFFKPAILFDFVSNVPLSSLSVLSVLFGAEIIVENT